MQFEDEEIKRLATADCVFAAILFGKTSFVFHGRMNQFLAPHRTSFSSRSPWPPFRVYRSLLSMMASAVESMIVDEKQISDKPVDREKTCPLLLRVFCNIGRHHNIVEYSRGNVPSNELQIYTWMDATLREITALVKEVNPDARKKGTYFDFSLVTPEMRNSGYRMREIGVTCSGQRGADDNKTLAQARFTIGDYLDISITPPNRMTQPMMRRGGLRQY